MNVETGWNLFDILDILVFTSGIRLKTFFSTTKEMKMPEKLTKCTCKRCQTCSKKAQDRCVSWQPKNVFFLENIRAVDPRIWKIRHVFENWHVQGRNQIFWRVSLLLQHSCLLWILRNLSERLFWRTSANGCFWKNVPERDSCLICLSNLTEAAKVFYEIGFSNN